ncbi:transposase [Prevotella intermedia ZT]|uniref:Transposase n=1 Tax=Prevotella intermedia ZT TaxID=1347790 RepID=A0AAP0YLV0_PREIN|nr:transposase [Prevotella intermedia ZT]KJJ86140.1 transposase [Prevotella intermedia ZT]KJJ86148.1 transposase [Prevotella intermedia ZT]KJJ86714.1 transposase [Prevotella intermedia ZT]
MGHAAKYLSLDVCHAELVCGTGEGRADGILYALQCIGND